MHPVADPALAALGHEFGVLAHLRGAGVDGLHLGVGEFLLAEVAGVEQWAGRPRFQERDVEEELEVGSALPLRHQHRAQVVGDLPAVQTLAGELGEPLFVHAGRR
ncbi:acyl-CoA dehydrogenase N-terminal domain-containing protein [Actinomadura rugatobispora]|uniref:Acyl-CoA dehydrogenase N-terminal domain-containing protein n=1 Tax=Actinomadura rugatobispora TaxID=1994 RepID=A0ABW1AEP3_9ACTN